MIVAFARNQVLIAATNEDMLVTTDPVAMGTNTLVDLALNLHTSLGVGGAAGCTLDVNVYGSNDLQHWVQLYGESRGAPGVYHRSDEVTTAFLRMEFIASVGVIGWGAVAFDVHTNLTRT